MKPATPTPVFAPRTLLLALAMGAACSSSGGEPARDTFVADVEPDGTGDTAAPDEGEVESDTTAGDRPLGSPCAVASECAPGLICVLATATESEFSCVDPSDGVYDDGSDPALAMVDAGAGWVRKRADGWEEQDLRCNDGSPYGYYLSPGAKSDRWLIYFKGGGLCTSAEACAFRWAIQGNYMRQWRSVQANPTYHPGARTGAKAGIFSNTGRLTDDGETLIPNVFSDYNVVHLHYCSSDLFSGTSRPQDNPARMYFRGSAIVTAVLEELLAGVDLSPLGRSLPPLSQASEVVILGGSAGATGARLNADRMADAIKRANPDTVVLALTDSVLEPGVRPQSYHPSAVNELYAPVMDADCVEAHGADSPLCTDGLHLLTGKGRASYFGGADDGHLGVAGSEETWAVERQMTFMATGDGMAVKRAQVLSICAREECVDDADCAPGGGCLAGVCFDARPCRAELCTPDDGACYGLDDAPSCLAGVATHRNACNDDATCPGGLGCCADGEVCLSGYCIEDIYLGCETRAECPEGYQCVGRTCSAGVERPRDCDRPGYVYTEDTGTCDQLLGCSAEQTCSPGYTCLTRDLTPNAQTFELSLIEQLRDTPPELGVYLPDSNTHTAISGEKYYGIKMPRIRGDTFADAVNQWYTQGLAYTDHLMTPPDVPIALWTWEIEGMTATGLATTDSGCADDAVALLLCAVTSPCAGPEDSVAVLAIGDAGQRFASRGALSEGVPLKLVVRANPMCGASPVTAAEGASLAIELRYGEAASMMRTVTIALPAGTLDRLPPALYLGTAGTLYSDAALTNVVLGRSE